MDRLPFKTLARFVQTLAVGRPVELPFALGARGTEWAETFVVGPDRINGGDTVLHKTSNRKNGNVREQMADVTDQVLDRGTHHNAATPIQPRTIGLEVDYRF